MFDGWCRFKYTTKFRPGRKWHAFDSRFDYPPINGLFLFPDWIRDSGLLPSASTPSSCFMNNRVTRRLLLSFRFDSFGGTRCERVKRRSINKFEERTARREFHNNSFSHEDLLLCVDRTYFVTNVLFLLLNRSFYYWSCIARVYIWIVRNFVSSNFQSDTSEFLGSFF